MTYFDNFEPRALKFDIDNAWGCAHAAALAYPSEVREGDGDWRKETNEEWEDRVRAEMSHEGFTHFDFFDHMGTQSFIAGKSDLIIMSFRGTEVDSIQDIAADLRIRKIGAPLAGKAHRGFIAALMAVWDDFNLPGGGKFIGMEHSLKRMRKDLNGGSPALWITGHSLGAALATLAAGFLLEEGRPIQGVYTFGCPRVGDHDFVMALNARLNGRNYRLVNNNDIVTRVPPRSFGYDHAGEFWYLSEGGDLKDDPNSWYLFLDRALGDLCDIGVTGLDAIKDHAMNNAPDGYIPQLAKAMGKGD